MRKRERVANLPQSDIISRYVHLFLLPFSSSPLPLPPAFRSTFPPFSALFHMQNHRRRSIVVHCGIGPVHPSFISRHPSVPSSETSSSSPSSSVLAHPSRFILSLSRRRVTYLYTARLVPKFFFYFLDFCSGRAAAVSLFQRVQNKQIKSLIRSFRGLSPLPVRFPSRRARAPLRQLRPLLPSFLHRHRIALRIPGIHQRAILQSLCSPSRPFSFLSHLSFSLYELNILTIFCLLVIAFASRFFCLLIKGIKREILCPISDTSKNLPSLLQYFFKDVKTFMCYIYQLNFLMQIIFNVSRKKKLNVNNVYIRVITELVSFLS